MCLLCMETERLKQKMSSKITNYLQTTILHTLQKYWNTI